MWFARFMVSIRSQTHRQGEVRLTEMTVQSLAVLAFHKIQFDFLSESPTDSGALKKLLAVEPGNMGSKSNPVKLDLYSGSPDFKKILSDLIEPLKKQGPFKFDMHYWLENKDFQPVYSSQNRDPREKSGFIRLEIKTMFKDLEDEFLFACPVKVTSAWIPLLSKFNLFIDDTGNDKWRFNIVKTDPDGNLLPGSPVPIVLYNGSKISEGDLLDPEALLKKRTGWVYFGGPATILNIARGDKPGMFSESFHHYETFEPSMNCMVGFYITWESGYLDSINGNAAIVQWDKGICDEAGAGVSTDWFSFVRNTPDEDKMIRNSIFRLFGVEAQNGISPTIVLGKVYRGQISARGYQTYPLGLLKPAFFMYVPKQFWVDYLDREYDSSISRDGYASIATFARDVLKLDETPEKLNYYREHFVSQATQQAYNSSLAFISTNRTVAHPFSRFSSWSWLYKTMQAVSDIPEMNALPMEIAGYSAVKPLPEIIRSLPEKAHTFIQLASVAEELSLNLDDDSGISLPEILAARGFFRGGSQILDLNGWVKIEGCAKNGLKIDRPMQLASNGGIIVDAGNLIVEQEISGGDYSGGDRQYTPKHTLQLLAMNGNIETRLKSDKSIDAVLTASDQVRMRNEKQKIRGAVATGRFDLANASAGALIYYNQNLALEAGEGTDPNGLELLCYSLDPTPIYLR